MHFFARLSLIILLLAFSYPGHVQAMELKGVLDKLIQSYGGEENLRMLDTMTQRWDVVALMGNRHGTDVRDIRVPDQLRVELNYPGKSETRILNGNMAYYRSNVGPARDVTVFQRDAMRLQLMRLYSPLVLRDKIDSVSLTEDGNWLALSLAEYGVKVHYQVNRDSWRIEKVSGVMSINEKEMQFLTIYSDFAVVEGALLHHKENKFAGDVNTAVLQLKKVSFDVQFDDSRFVP